MRESMALFGVRVLFIAILPLLLLKLLGVTVTERMSLGCFVVGLVVAGLWAWRKRE